MAHRIEKYLPAGCTVEYFAGEFVLISATLTLKGYRELVKTLPAPLQERIIGFRQVARLPLQKAA